MSGDLAQASIGSLQRQLQRLLDELAAQTERGALERARLHCDVVYLALDTGDTATAMSHALSSLELARTSGDGPAQVKAYVALALVQAEAYDELGAARQFERAAAVAREVGDDRGVALVAVNASHYELERGEYGAALGRLRMLRGSAAGQGLQAGPSRELHDTFHINFVMGAAEALLGGLVAAPEQAEVQAQLQESARLLERLLDDGPLAQPLHALFVRDALTRDALWRGDLPGAQRLVDEQLRLVEQADSLLLAGRAQLGRSRVATLAEQWDTAVQAAGLAVQHFETAGDALWVARGREVLAEVYACTGQFQQAFAVQRAVTRGVEALFRNYHQQRALVSQIEQQANEAEVRAATMAQAALRDPLTGAPNRLRAMQVLAERHLQARRGHPSAVALLDLDSFKAVNDTYGHGAGDTVLSEVARLLSAELRQDDCLARFGGEEFVLILNGVRLPEAQATCERLRLTLARTTWPQVAPGFAVTASFGVTTLDGQADLKASLQAADEALYAAKAAGRNTVRSTAGSGQVQPG